MAESKASPGASASIEPEMVRRLADLLIETGLSEIEVERQGLRIRVARTLAPGPTVYAAAPTAAALAAATTPAAAAEDPRGEAVTSPMVGTIYLKPQPEAEPFVRVGDRVTTGQTLLVVEAMKTMNPIPAPRDGVVLAILVDDAQPVEFGAPLVIIE